MGHDFPILGFRQDRSGARLICLLDILRLSRKFGVEARYLWLSQPDGPYPELADPAVFFAPELIESHILLVADMPDLVGRRPLSSVAPVSQCAQFAQALLKGQTFLGGTMIEATRFSDETPAEVGAQLHAIVESLPLAPRLQRALGRARRDIRRSGRGDAAAIHVRRGDILDGHPWSYRAWQAKYVPDEFFRAFVDQHDGPVIAFSDTPAAVRHLARGDARILPVDDLLSGEGLSLAERDMLELLLMSGCATIAAPASSAFSMAAAMIGSARVLPLPAALAPKQREAAHDALLDRVIQTPDSFYAPGDLAQSMVYAAQHAIASGRGGQLLDGFRPPPGFLDRFPFTRYWLGMAAFSCGRRMKARNLAAKAIANDMLRNTERQAARQLIELTRIAPDSDETLDEAAFLGAAFNTGGGPLMPLLAHRILGGGGRAAQALMFGPDLVALLETSPEPGMTAHMAGASVTDARALAAWTYLSEWSELVDNNALRDSLPRFPPLGTKLAAAEDLLKHYEPRLSGGERPDDPGDDAVLRLGFGGSKLGLHGRLKRAFLILHWLEGLRPQNALIRKRLADCCFRAGNAKAGDRWLAEALRLAPDNPLLQLSAARRAIAVHRFATARDHIARARTLWPELDLVRLTQREFRRANRAHNGAEPA